ncbi:hypothetical protein [Flavobacterium sp. N3904]|uniref:hypothetical protein n=1 Tax=Flavobacterium sp. N3904 TaxID=2986835 RepID=UPI0022254296|nr:hypothetical protein [Flavobacterium sp. N3904]
MSRKVVHFKIVALFVFSLFSLHTYSQESLTTLDTDLEIQSYKKMKVPSTFSNELRDDDDKANFKKLRDFLNRKKNLLNLLNNAELDTYVNPADMTDNDEFIKTISRYIEGKPDNFLIPLEDLNDIYNYKYDSSYDKKYKVKELKENLEALQKKKIDYANKNKEHEYLVKNIEIVNQDINVCQNQIDTALDPENRKQEFKTTMSICFVGLIGILLVSFFLIVYLRSDNTLSKDLLGGYGLQFITLFVLIIAIILFGILDILKGSELAAMLSGISGYILGKGIQDKKLIPDPTNTTVVTPSAQDSNLVIPVTPITDPIPPNPGSPDPIIPDPPAPDTSVPDPNTANLNTPDPNDADPNVSDPNVSDPNNPI